MSILINILLVIHVIVSLLIIFVTLMQRPKNEGLGAALGGGVTSDIFGAQASNVLTSFTRWLGGIFFGLTLLISILYAQTASKPSSIKKELMNSPKVVATPTPAPAASGSNGKSADGKSGPIPIILDTTKPTGTKQSGSNGAVPFKLAPETPAKPALPGASVTLGEPTVKPAAPKAPEAIKPAEPVKAPVVPAPTVQPTVQPTATPAPTVQPTATPAPTVQPTATPAPTVQPTAPPAPTVQPTATPVPTVQPTAAPAAAPTSATSGSHA